MFGRENSVTCGPNLEISWQEFAFRWFAVYTRSHCERKLAQELSDKRIENYLPVVPEIHRWKDRKKRLEIPVFPGYVFAKISGNESSRLAVLRSAGAVRILGRGSSIEAIPDQEIEAIRQLLETRTPFFAHPFPRKGAWVRIARGPLKDLEGVFVRAKNQGRLVLSVNLLAQSVATEIDVCDVEVLRPRVCSKPD